MTEQIVTPLMGACIELIGRCGASDWQLRWSDDQEPTVWLAVGTWRGGRVVQTCGPQFLVGAGLTPEAAAVDLAERAVDGGLCTHCNRPTGLTAELEEMPLADEVCWYQWDPELETFRRSCEGETP